MAPVPAAVDRDPRLVPSVVPRLLHRGASPSSCSIQRHPVLFLQHQRDGRNRAAAAWPPSKSTANDPFSPAPAQIFPFPVGGHSRRRFKMVRISKFLLADAIEKDLLLQQLIWKCGGIPKVIVGIAEYLRQAFNWKPRARNLNNMFMQSLESMSHIASLHGVLSWMHSYFVALPKHIKQHVAYLLILPSNRILRRRRLLMRWIAEGYSTDSERQTAHENGEEVFTKLVQLSMIKPPCGTTIINMRMAWYTVNDFIHNYMISMPEEENVASAIEVFSLEGPCSATTRRRGRHLVIKECWKRDSIVFESIDFSRLRSFTVFGEWRPFFISESMKVLRVLDLENASGMTNKDIQIMLKLLPRLKFLSLRGCSSIRYLPNSIGNLRQLQTLDIRHTSITTLPASITKLKKLQYLRAGTTVEAEYSSTPRAVEFKLPKLRRCRQLAGIEVESALTALHTLGVVNVGTAGGKAILKLLMDLTQLRKLGVSGVCGNNNEEFCYAVSCHYHLQSLSVWLKKKNQYYLHDMALEGNSLKRLQSLKLYRVAKKLPGWINKQLCNLRKLNLEIDVLSNDDIGVLGVLPELCILRLLVKPPQDCKLNFCVIIEGAEEPSFVKVQIFDIACLSGSLNVSFGLRAMLVLEQLSAGCCKGSMLQFAELKHLKKLNEVHVFGSHDETLKRNLQAILIDHPGKPTLKQEEMTSNVHFPFLFASDDSTMQ